MGLFATGFFADGFDFAGDFDLAFADGFAFVFRPRAAIFLVFVFLAIRFRLALVARLLTW